MTGRPGTDQNAAPRLRRRRTSLRGLLALASLTALVAASTVVSGGSVLRLPVVWQVVTAPPAPGPGFPLLGADAVMSADDEGTADQSVRREEQSARANDPQTLARVTTHLLKPGDYQDDLLQAGTERSAAILRSQQIIVGPQGRLRGTLVPVGDPGDGQVGLHRIRIRILRSGALVTSVRSDDTGAFEVSGLRTGTHAFLVGEEDALAAFSFHVLRQEERPEEEEASIVLRTPLVTGDDVPAALRQLARLPTDPEVIAKKLIEPDETLIPKAVRSVRQRGIPGTALHMHPVVRQPDGSLLGRVHLLHPESGRPLRPLPTDVVLHQGGAVVASTTTDRAGNFSIADVEPGAFALVATTRSPVPDDERLVEAADGTQTVKLVDDPPRIHGFAAFAIDVLPHDDPAGRLAGEENGDPDLQIDFALVSAHDLSGWTQLTSVASSTTTANSPSVAGLAPSGDKTAPIAPAPQQSPILSSPASGGGGGGSLTFPIVPTQPQSSLMSPATL